MHLKCGEFLKAGNKYVLFRERSENILGVSKCTANGMVKNK
jgi:hypothetical protein